MSPHVFGPLAVGNHVTVAWHHDRAVTDDVVRGVMRATRATLTAIKDRDAVGSGPPAKQVARYLEMGLDAPDLLAVDTTVARITPKGTIITSHGLRFERDGRGLHFHRGPGSHDRRFVIAKRVSPKLVSVHVRVDIDTAHVIADLAEASGFDVAAVCVREVIHGQV